jgi:hypothetical protein
LEALLGKLTCGGAYAGVIFCLTSITVVFFGLTFGAKYKNATAARTPNPAATKILFFNNNYKIKEIKG